MIDEETEYTGLCNPSGKSCTVRLPIEYKDKQRVEYHVDSQSDSVDGERNLASSAGIEDARKGCRHEHEREGRGNDSEVIDRIVGNMLFKFIKTDDGGSESKQYECPSDGNHQGKTGRIQSYPSNQ